MIILHTQQVKFKVFLMYLKNLGVLAGFFTLLFSMATQAFMAGSRYWLADWSMKTNITNDERDYLLGLSISSTQTWHQNDSTSWGHRCCVALCYCYFCKNFNPTQTGGWGSKIPTALHLVSVYQHR